MTRQEHNEKTKRLAEEGKLWKVGCCMNCYFWQYTKEHPLYPLCTLHKAEVEIDNCCEKFSTHPI